MATDGTVLRVGLSDRAAEGWPRVEVGIPTALRFRQATSSVLTRTASFSAPGTLEDARAWFSDAGLRFPPNGKCVKLGGGARMKVSTVGPEVSVVIQQRRKDEDLRDAIMDRMRSYSESP